MEKFYVRIACFTKYFQIFWYLKINNTVTRYDRGDRVGKKFEITLEMYVSK